MKAVMILLKVFILGGLLIISNSELALSNVESRDVFFDQYGQWLQELFNNGVTVVGYVVGTEWLPDQDYGQKIEVRK